MDRYLHPTKETKQKNMDKLAEIIANRFVQSIFRK